ncbi:MAG: Jag N-terminal domain-containing protein [Ardenticatenaceae bacterium]|nr:Jag N-terminal domain-containing protein [Ardenticatenaceae bacterium]
MSNEQNRVIEAQGPDVEAAIASGLAKLRAAREDVEVEILDRGSKGLLGIGARDAVVRLTSKVQAAPVKTPEPPVKTVEAQPQVPVKTAVSTPSPPPPAPTKQAPEPKPEPEPAAPTDESEEEQTLREQERETAVTVISELLAKMRVDADLDVSLSPPDDLTGRQVNIIEIHGQDMSSLIGPRGETLNSLQYVARLMVGHQLRQRASFVVDVENYRQRREQALKRLAERMAQKVAKRKRAISLEPMPPHERRIIHMTLRDDQDVYTESTGEGKRRKVRIIPKK